MEACNVYVSTERQASVLQPLLVDADQTIPLLVGRHVDLLPGGVGVEPGQRPLDPACKRRGRAEAGDKSFDLGIIEYDADCLVAQQAVGHIRQAGGDEIGRDMDDVGFDAGGSGDRGIDLTPGKGS